MRLYRSSLDNPATRSDAAKAFAKIMLGTIEQAPALFLTTYCQDQESCASSLAQHFADEHLDIDADERAEMASRLQQVRSDIVLARCKNAVIENPGHAQRLPEGGITKLREEIAQLLGTVT